MSSSGGSAGGHSVGGRSSGDSSSTSGLESDNEENFSDGESSDARPDDETSPNDIDGHLGCDEQSAVGALYKLDPTEEDDSGKKIDSISC